MKVKELREILNHTDDHDEDELVIRLSMPSIGPVATSKVKYVHFGFDWEHGKVLIEPEGRLSIKTKEQDVYDMSRDLLMEMATAKSTSYRNKLAKNILLRAGFTQEKLNQYRHLFHKDEENETKRGPAAGQDSDSKAGSKPGSGETT